MVDILALEPYITIQTQAEQEIEYALAAGWLVGSALDRELSLAWRQHPQSVVVEMRKIPRFFLSAVQGVGGAETTALFTAYLALMPANCN